RHSFFFSSRRRHTRWPRDWSSDVCSSDLYEVEEHPLLLQDIWEFQHSDPVAESRYSLQLPAGWEYKASWLNYAEIMPTQAGTNRSEERRVGKEWRYQRAA